jgi:hypothetical protein
MVRRHVAAARIPTPSQQDRLEVRLLTIYVTLSFANDLVGPITYIYQVAPSMLFKVASLAHATGVIGLLFIVSLVLMLPHVFSLLFLPRKLGCRWPRKLACLAAAISSLTWFYLAVLASPLDMGPLSLLYGRQGLESLFLSLLFAVSLNAQQLRSLHDWFFTR